MLKAVEHLSDCRYEVLTKNAEDALVHWHVAPTNYGEAVG